MTCVEPLALGMKLGICTLLCSCFGVFFFKYNLWCFPSLFDICWFLLFLIGCCCCFLIGFVSKIEPGPQVYAWSIQIIFYYDVNCNYFVSLGNFLLGVSFFIAVL